MSLLFFDSFDHYDTANINAKWPVRGSNTTINATLGRRDGGTLVIGSSSNAFVLRACLATSTFVFGAAVYPTTYSGTSRCLFALYSNSAFVLGLHVNVAGQLFVARGLSGSNLVIAGAGTLPINTWSYVEWKVTLDPATGASEVRINGVAAHVESTIATTASATSANAFGIASDSSSNLNYQVDDFYLCDTLGSVNNDFLGDVEVRATVPDEDGFYTSQYARSSGSDDFSLVDENPPNTTDYLESDASGEKVSLNMAALSGIAGIVGVQVNNYAQKTDAGTALARNLIRSNGVDANGADYGLSTSPLYGISMHETNPDGDIPWTLAAVNAAQVGQENRS